ncbi:MAG: dihydrodipicolinate synthase family protein [Planctomycetaceae bacterium]|nr:dihydrodipicolinate synthase family protein [Planctomycetaceae bacterium]MDP7276130.1 dihydrodipicolinate synthase family protein [Planctomycetaceae bacterium]
MDQQQLRQRLQGCYVTIPTLFEDDDLAVNLPGIGRHVEFLLAGGLQEGTGIILSGGGAGDFSTMTIAERLEVARTVVEAAAGRIPVTVGAQTTSTAELVELARAAQAMGADYIQVSPPFYFSHTEDDFFEYIQAASQAAPEIGLIVYNTYWTSMGVSHGMVERLIELPNMAGLKWSSPGNDFFGFERVVEEFAGQVAIIDNQLKFVTSHMLGARSIELHICNHWPEWGVGLWGLLEAGSYSEAHHGLMEVVAPYYRLWAEMEKFTSGDGYLDKLCMELVGLDSSRCRPPTRDVRERFRETTRQMLIDCGTPNVADRV